MLKKIHKIGFLCLISLSAVNLANAAATTVSWAPVPVDLTNKSTLLAQRGAYLVRLINCQNCHSTVSQPAGTDAAKDGWKVTQQYYLSGGKVQGGVKVANLTPDALGNPAGLSLKQFKAAMKQGVSSIDSSKKIVSMPWPTYAEMTDTDVKAIYEYLRSIPPLAMGPATAPAAPATGTTTGTPTTGTTTGTTTTGTTPPATPR
jgi:mono/diheme cytochrome c family protein